MTFARLALHWMGFSVLGFVGWLLVFGLGWLRAGWLWLFFLPSWLLGLIGFGWLWAGLAFCFCRVGFGLLDWLWVGWLWLFANSSWHFAGLALG